MNDITEGQTKNRTKKSSNRVRNTILFGIVAVAWLIFDILSKNYFNENHSVGTLIGEPILGLFRFHLVHNTGAAWGLFGDSTTTLGIMSMVVCCVIIIYFFVTSARANIGQVVGLGMVLAGGLGNGMDRFTLGYVVDFIDFTFIDFPVFNIADIGVTCGFVLFLASMLYSWSKEDRLRKEAEELKAAAMGSPLPDDSEVFDAKSKMDDEEI